jgi:hypothetical protein
MRQRFYRRRSAFIRDPRAYSTPLDREARHRILTVAEGLERRTKAPGRKSGTLGASGLDVLRALLKRMNYASGLCFPSYLTLCAMTGLCRSTIAKALKRLESAGVVRITRRLKRILVTRTSPLTGLPERLMLTTQDSNLYAFSGPDALAGRVDGMVEAYVPDMSDPIERLLARYARAESSYQPETLTLFR